EQFGGAAEQGSAGDDQKTAENVEAHHPANAENENAEQDEAGKELFCKVRRAAPVSGRKGKSAYKKQQNPKAGVANLRGHEGGNSNDNSGEEHAMLDRPAGKRGRRKDGVKLLAKGSGQGTMHRWPVR